jgi:photosystem II stability/assembly factor-like uncharacterized protein
MLARYLVLLIAAVLAQLGLRGGTIEPERASAFLKLQPVSLSWIHMSTLSIGWALSGKGVMRTTDGGLQWRKIAGLPRSAKTPYASVAAHGPSEAWVAAHAGKNVDAFHSKVRIFSTTDGGRHWFRSRALRGFGSSLDFVDSRHGWLFTGLGVATGSMSHNLYRTSDGGRTWRLVEYNHIDTSSKGSLNSCDGLDGVSFRTPTDGWSAGWCGAGPQILMFYRSSDRGRTWRARSLPWPHGYHVNSWIVALPAFIGTYGVLPVSLASPAAFVLYVTHDGGEHWLPTTPIRTLDWPDAFMLDRHHVWSVVGGTLYQSFDSGLHWQPLTHHFPATELDFVTDRSGFALNGPEPIRRPQMLRTDDGGRSWRIIETVLIG